MGSNEFIEIPVLVFLKDKIVVSNIDVILNIVSSFYNEVELKAAKKTIYKVMDCETAFVDSRGGDTYKENFTAFHSKLSTAPPLKVKFCVTNFRRLPSVDITM